MVTFANLLVINCSLMLMQKGKWLSASARKQNQYGVLMAFYLDLAFF